MSSMSAQTPSSNGGSNNASPASVGGDNNHSNSGTASAAPEVPRPKRIACVVCRKRKLRCDGSKPSCGTCSRLGHEWCAFLSFLLWLLIFIGAVTAVRMLTAVIVVHMMR